MLVLNMLLGLNERYHGTTTIIKIHQPFPIFLQARSFLVMDEQSKLHSTMVVAGAFFSLLMRNRDPSPIPPVPPTLLAAGRRPTRRGTVGNSDMCRHRRWPGSRASTPRIVKCRHGPCCGWCKLLPLSLFLGSSASSAHPRH